MRYFILLVTIVVLFVCVDIFFAAMRRYDWPDWANFRACDGGRIRYFQNEPDPVDGYWIDYLDGRTAPGGKGIGFWIEARPKK